MRLNPTIMKVGLSVDEISEECEMIINDGKFNDLFYLSTMIATLQCLFHDYLFRS